MYNRLTLKAIASLTCPFSVLLLGQASWASPRESHASFIASLCPKLPVQLLPTPY